MLHPGQRRLIRLVSNGAIGEVSLVRTTRSSMGPGSRHGAPADFSWFYQGGAGGMSLVRTTRSSMGPGAPTDFSWFYQGGAGGMSSMTGYGLITMTAVLGAVKSLAAMSCISA